MKCRGDIYFGRGDNPSTAARSFAERLLRRTRREGEWPAGSKTVIGATKCPV